MKLRSALLKVCRQKRQILTIGLCFLSVNVFAQEEGFLDSSTSSAIVEPPPIAGAWAGSAVSNFLLEDGATVSRRRSPWSMMWFNWANFNMRDFSEGAARLETYNYLSFDYRLDWNSKISVRPEFYLSGAGRDFYGDDAEGEAEMGDIYVQYTHNRWALLSSPFGDVGLAGSLRAYYPNSTYAKMQKQLTRLQARMIFQMPLAGGVWMSYHFRPMYLVQTQKAYLNEFYNPKSNEHYRLEQRLEFSKPFANRWAAHQDIGVEHRHYYESEANGLKERTDGFFSMSTGISWYGGTVSFKGGLAYEAKIARPDRNPQLYNAADTKYFLMTNVRL